MDRTAALIAVLLCVIACTVLAADAAEPHRVKWRFLGNDDPVAGHCTAEFTIELARTGHAHGSEAEAWLYFNFGRKPAQLGQDGSAASYEHVNGDLFRLRLTASDVAGTARNVRIVSQGAIRSISDAPAGGFVVMRDAVGAERVDPVAFEIDLTAIATEPVSLLEVSADGVRIDAAPESAGGPSATAPLVPQPLRYTTGSLPVPLSGLPIVSSARLRNHADQIAAALSAGGFANVEIVDTLAANRPAIRLSLGDLGIPGLSKHRSREAYRLDATADAGIRVIGATPAGVHYGVQTLVALLANAEARAGHELDAALRETSITDAPHFAYRGLHLDVARNFQEPVTVRKLLDLMAAYKLNRFHFHLTDDEGWRIAIRGLPELTEVGGHRGYPFDAGDRLPPSFGSGPSAGEAPGSGYYTREEFIALLRHANERHIEVIPEIDLPGHARAAIQAMQVRYQKLAEAGDRREAERYLLRRPDDGAVYESVQMWSDNVVDVRLESTYAFLDHVVAELASMFEEAGVSLKTLHIGGDEVPAGSWGDGSADGKQRLFAGFVDRFAEIARSHGLRIGGWEEVFLEADHRSPRLGGGADGGLCYAWNNIWGWGQEDAAYRLANAGVDVVLCNATHLYFDLAYRRDVDEPGYYWAGVTNTEEVFRFRPYTYFDGLTQDRNGAPIRADESLRKERLTKAGRARIAGMQGQLWSETIVSADRLERMAFPRLLALAERAWAGPADGQLDGHDPRRTWEAFSRHLGESELPRLDEDFGGVRYRVPSVHVARDGDSVSATPEFAGFVIRQTTDGSEPSASSAIHKGPLPAGGEYRFRCFDRRGRGGPIADWRRPTSASRPQSTVR